MKCGSFNFLTLRACSGKYGDGFTLHHGVCKIQSDQKFSEHLMITVLLQYSINPHTTDDLKMAIHSECGPCYIEHGL
jgi:hypothetical protein